MQRVPMTREGHQKLQEELDRLLKVERPKNIQAIAEARDTEIFRKTQNTTLQKKGSPSWKGGYRNLRQK